MEQKYLAVRKQLEELGYYHSLHPDDVPLVEKLTGDLLQTTESLQKYMKISQEVVTERDNLLLGAEPFKCDNAKLVKECNELHLAFLQYREQNEKLQTDLKRRVAVLEKEKIDSDLHVEKLKSHLKDLELDAVRKSTRQLQIETARLGGKSLKSSSTTALLRNKTTSKDLSAAMSLAEEKIANLTKEICRLKEEKLELAEANIAYKNQINSRDREIQRLTHMLKGGRPMEALNQDCCYKDVEVKYARMQDDINSLKRSNSDLEERLKEAICKQHEAMKRALSLAERNRVLEKEMKDIDQMALAVEKECNTTVKGSTEKVNRLQNRLHESILQIQQLEKEAADLKRDKQELLSDLEGVKVEKRHLQSILENALEEKKRLSTRLNQYGIIENDLNLEIDRLVQASADQKRKIAELECKLLSGKLDQSLTNTHKDTENNHQNKPSGSMSPKKKKKSPPKAKTKTKTVTKFPRTRSGCDSPLPVPENTPQSQFSARYAVRKDFEDAATSPIPMSCSHPEQCYRAVRDIIDHEIKNKNVCIEHLKEVIGQEIDELQAKANSSFDQFKQERDYYMKECHSLMEKLKCMCNKTDNLPELQNKLSEKEQQLTALQYENRCLSQEKHNLMTRLETARDHTDRDLDTLSYKAVLRRLERERDLLKGDIQRLEEERDGLRHRINLACENHNQEKGRLEAMIREQEEIVHKLEQDRRDYMHTQGSRRATVNNLQGECDMLNSQLKICQSDLNQQRAMYTQLKSLHEQTDRALSDCQSQLTQSEKEMCMLQERIKGLESHKEDARKEVINLKNDLTVMKNNLARLDQDKDTLLHDLDEKTERIVTLDEELKTKQSKITSLETNLNEIRKRMNDNLSERSSKEHLIRQANSETQRLQQELDDAIRSRDMAYQENRRLQDDLASCTNDNRKLQNELDIAKRQVDDVKRQLQHYVAEVKRAEDLISQKEIERTEMLDHYRSLTEEASNLESTNHTLESEASQAKIQLSVTLDHAADMERKVEVQETMIRDCEKQIADLTSQIARLETRVEQSSIGKERIEDELASVRELCVKLDKQKDSLMRQLNEQDSGRQEMVRECDRLRQLYQTSQTDMQRERTTIESLEKHLAQCRQECVDQRLLNEELQEEIKKLKARVLELQHKLATTTGQLDMYQEKALDYSNQNKQLRREVVNERYHRSREDDLTKRYPEPSEGSKSHEPVVPGRRPSSLIIKTNGLKTHEAVEVLNNSKEKVNPGNSNPPILRQPEKQTDKRPIQKYNSTSSAIRFPEFTRRIEILEEEEEDMRESTSVHFSDKVDVRDQVTLVPIVEQSEESLVWVSQDDRAMPELAEEEEEEESVDVPEVFCTEDTVVPAKPAESNSSTSMAMDRDDNELAATLAVRTRSHSVVNFGACDFRITESEANSAESLAPQPEEGNKDDQIEKEVPQTGDPKKNGDNDSLRSDETKRNPCQCWKYCSCRRGQFAQSGGARYSGISSGGTAGVKTTTPSFANRYTATYSVVYEPRLPK